MASGVLPASLVEAYHSAAGNHKKKFEMLKKFLLSDELTNKEMVMYMESNGVSSTKEVFEEIMLLDLHTRYGATEAGRKYIEDITTSQKPMKNPKKELRNNPMYNIYRIFRGRKAQSGTENKAGSRIVGGGQLPVEAAGDEVEITPDDSASGVDGTKALSSSTAKGSNTSTPGDKKNLLGSIMDSMRPLPPTDCQDKKKKKKRKNSSDSSSSGPPRKEKKVLTQEQQDKKEVDKIMGGIRKLAEKAISVGQDLTKWNASEEMKSSVAEKHTWLTGVGTQYSSRMANGATCAQILAAYQKKRKTIQECEDYLDGIKGQIRVWVSKDKKRKKDKKEK